MAEGTVQLVNYLDGTCCHRQTQSSSSQSVTWPKAVISHVKTNKNTCAGPSDLHLTSRWIIMHAFVTKEYYSYWYSGYHIEICPPPLTQNHVPLDHFWSEHFSPVFLLQVVRLSSTSSVLSVLVANLLYCSIIWAVPWLSAAIAAALTVALVPITPIWY